MDEGRGARPSLWDKLPRHLKNDRLHLFGVYTMLERWRLMDGRIMSDAAAGNIFLYVSPDESERRFLIDAMKIDEHTLASSLDPDELARLESEPDHMAIILKRPRNYSSADAFVFGVTSVGLFLFADRLVIVASEDGLLFEGKRFSKMVSLRDLVLKILDHAIAHFLEHLRVINAVSDSLEDQINTSMQNKYLLNLFSLEKSLVYYLNAINSNGKLIERLRNNLVKLGFTPENVEYLDDMAIENTQCYEQAEIYSNILASMMDARASIVNNNLNWLMKTLTLITLGVMLPSLVVSIFSMNVKFPGMDHPWTFWIVLVLAAGSAMSVWVMGWLRKW